MTYVYAITGVAILAYLVYTYFKNKRVQEDFNRQQVEKQKAQEEFKKAEEELNKAIKEKKVLWEAKRDAFYKKYPNGKSTV